MLTLLVAAPLAFAAIAFFIPSNSWRPWTLPLAATLELALVGWLVFGGETATAPGEHGAIEHALNGPVLNGPVLNGLVIYEHNRWLALDPLGAVFLLLVATLFFLAAGYAPTYLSLRPDRDNRVFCGCVLVSQGMMTLIILSHHLGLLWVALEATTLATAPGIYFNQNARSLEATWKYLLICSVGVALALFGSLLLAFSALDAQVDTTLLFDDLVREAPRLSPPWLRAAFMMLLVGYGTKMGLAPLHAWKPETYSEAPGMLAALLAGGMTSCALLAILRFYQILVAAGKIDVVQPVLIVMGIVSMAVAAAFMARQKDFKRMLAFSSVEQMGILAFGVGVGGPAIYFTLLHMLGNGILKLALFLSAGNIHRAFDSKFVGETQGAARRLPISGGAFFVAFLAIGGAPPFSTFLSKLGIVSAAFSGQHYLAAGLFLTATALVFLAMGAPMMGLVFGKPTAPPVQSRFRDQPGTIWPILMALSIVVTLGVSMPPRVNRLLTAASEYLDHPDGAHAAGANTGSAAHADGPRPLSE